MRVPVWFDETTLEGDVARPATTRALLTHTSSWETAPKAPAVHLERGGIFSKPLEKGERLSVTLLSGHAWITLEGDPQDHVLTSNQQSVFTGPGLLVIEGLEQGARLQIHLKRE